MLSLFLGFHLRSLRTLNLLKSPQTLHSWLLQQEFKILCHSLRLILSLSLRLSQTRKRICQLALFVLWPLLGPKECVFVTESRTFLHRPERGGRRRSLAIGVTRYYWSGHTLLSLFSLRLWLICSPVITTHPADWERIIKLRGSGATVFMYVIYTPSTAYRILLLSVLSRYKLYACFCVCLVPLTAMILVFSSLCSVGDVSNSSQRVPVWLHTRKRSFKVR